MSKSNGEKFEGWTSFSGQTYPEVDFRNVFRDQLGLGVLFYDYVDGYIIRGEENWKRLVHYQGNLGKPRYLRILINSRQCEEVARMVQFFESFYYPPGTPISELEKRPKEQILLFNTMMDPFETYQRRVTTGQGLVGGGSVPFGVSMLKAIGMYRPEFDAFFQRVLNISEALIGGLSDPNTGQIRRVSISFILFGDLGRSWVHLGYQNHRLVLVDPEKIWKQIGEMQACAGGRCSEDGIFWMRSWGAQGYRMVEGSPHLYRDRYTVTIEYNESPPQIYDREARVEIPGVVLMPAALSP